MEIFQAIRKDHEKQKLLMKILVETQGNSESRREHFEELKQELKKHEVAEKEHFYAPLMERSSTEDTSRNALHEHHEIDDTLRELDDINMSSPAWIHKMRNLQTLVTEHQAEEEKFIFAMADVALNTREKKDLAEDYKEEKAEMA